MALVKRTFDPVQMAIEENRAAVLVTSWKYTRKSIWVKFILLIYASLLDVMFHLLNDSWMLDVEE